MDRVTKELKENGSANENDDHVIPRNDLAFCGFFFSLELWIAIKVGQKLDEWPL